jgi:hypothetical protein
MNEHDFEARYLAPQLLSFRRTESGGVEMTFNGEVYPSVRFYLVYPLSAPAKLVSIRDALDENQREIGLIAEVEKLAPEARRLVEQELAWRYFMPRIQRILSIKEQGIRQFWQVETDRGVRSFIIKDPYEHVRQIAEGRLLITDTYECRYEIADATKLDKDSRQLLSRHIYF